MNDPKKTIKELHARLHQKALELRDGKAFVNPNSWYIKFLKKYKTWNEFIRKTISVSLIIPFIFIPFLSWFMAHDILSFLVFVIITTLCVCVPAGVYSLLEENTLDIKEETYQKLIKTLKKHPEMKGDIQILSDHLDHQDVLGTWWITTNEIIDQILELEYESENLNDLLNADDNILIEEPDTAGEPHTTPQHRRTIL